MWQQVKEFDREVHETSQAALHKEKEIDNVNN